MHDFELAQKMRAGVDLEVGDDEGMGEDEDEDEEDEDSVDLDGESMDVDTAPSMSTSNLSILQSLSSLFLFDTAPPSSPPKARLPPRNRHSAPSILPSLSHSPLLKPNYKLLYQTRIHLRNRILTSSYKLSILQDRGSPSNGHTNTIYCLQLYTYPETGVQTLFTGSKDRTIREWNLTTGCVERVIKGVHESSVLSLCVNGGLVASGGSDRRVVVWDLRKDRLVKMIMDHEDSVLCVRFDEERLVSCSKGGFSFKLYFFCHCRIFIDDEENRSDGEEL